MDLRGFRRTWSYRASGEYGAKGVSGEHGARGLQENMKIWDFKRTWS